MKEANSVKLEFRTWKSLWTLASAESSFLENTFEADQVGFEESVIHNGYFVYAIYKGLTTE